MPLRTDFIHTTLQGIWSYPELGSGRIPDIAYVGANGTVSLNPHIPGPARGPLVWRAPPLVERALQHLVIQTRKSGLLSIPPIVNFEGGEEARDAAGTFFHLLPIPNDQIERERLRTSVSFSHQFSLFSLFPRFLPFSLLLFSSLQIDC